MRVWQRQDGNILIMGTGVLAVVAALVLVVASAASVYLDLKTLTSLADSAAAAAAEGVDEEGYYGGAGTAGAPGVLTDAGVEAAARTDLAGQPAVLEDVRLVQAATPEGTTALITLQAHSRPPFLPWGIIPSEGFTITATGSARVTTVP